MILHYIDMVILAIDMGYGLMIWEMTVWTWSSPISIWDILSLCPPCGLAAAMGFTRGGKGAGRWGRWRG